MNYFSKYKLIVFDLDNTLILERDYLFEGYEEIACYIESTVSVEKLKIQNYLKDEFIKNGRTKLLSRMMGHFNIRKPELEVILNVLRTYTPVTKIALIKNMKVILEELKDENIPYVIFTNGNVDQQKNKVANIEWDGLLTDVIYANEISPKPDPISFTNYLLKSQIRIKKKEILMIGDSFVDELFAENLGCDFKDVSNFV